MTNTLRILNAAGDLVVDSDTPGTSCIGKANFLKTVQPYYKDSAWQTGYSQYTFATDRPVLWAFDLPLGRRVGIFGTSYQDGVHTVGVYCGTGGDWEKFDRQEAVDVWAFSTISQARSKFGLILRHSKEHYVTHDFGTPNITFPIASGSLGESVRIPPVDRPIAIGNAPFYNVSYFDLEPGYILTNSRYFLLRTANNTVGYTAGLTFKRIESQGQRGKDSTVSHPSPFLVIDGSFLP
ncbi:hypothetical protein OX462_10910 [Janthinobacterium sp. SUN098]|uniref:hypothetical protein n=1 Tax=Janthinobacterium sp. SUN098 TaxID=3002437 RepID=UPI0038D3A90F